MQALTVDEINWLILIVKNQTDFAPENERRLKINVLDYLGEQKRELESPNHSQSNSRVTA